MARDLLDMRRGGKLVQTGADYLDSGVLGQYNTVMYQVHIRPWPLPGRPSWPAPYHLVLCPPPARNLTHFSSLACSLAG
jgi:hypothetical protein